MLSDIHLKIPQSPSHSSSQNKKEHNVVLEYDPYVDRDSYKTL